MASTRPATIRVAVTQHEPKWLDLAGTVAKTIELVEEAAAAKAKLVTFPECWIPGYPTWIWSRTVDFELGVKYVENSLQVKSAEMQQIQEAAAANNINVALGYSERDGDSVYIAQALIDDKGKLAVTRRKVRTDSPLARTIFGDGTGDKCLSSVAELSEEGVDGKVSVGSLSCWEHLQPLLKHYTLSQNEHIHVGAWPPLDPFIEGSPGLWSMSVEGCRNLSQTYAAEAQAFVLHTTPVLSQAGVDLLKTAGCPIMGSGQSGSSCVIGPDGRVVAQSAGDEKLLVVDLDLSQVVKNKTFADAAGHYSRPDMIWLGVDKSERAVVRPFKVT